MTFLEPAYGSASLADVVPSVAAALGVPLVGMTSPIELPPASAYVVLLIDGLGAELLRAHARHAPFLSTALDYGMTGTAGVPSTTATSLASLGTGLAPGAHGIVGFTSRVPGTGHLLNALFWDRDVDPVAWQPHETAFARLASAGVHVSVVNKREFADSGLTRAAHRGGTYVGADRQGERVAACLAAVAERPALVYAYDADLDWTGHRHGVASVAWTSQLAAIDAETQQLRAALPPDVRLLVVADHGMVDCAGDDRFDLDSVPALRDGVVLVGGEARFRHLYAAAGATDDVAAAWRSVLGERAEVLTRGEAFARGWFGAVESRVAPRIGDVVVAARGSLGVFSSADFAYEMSLVGLHGSLTRAEMSIPLILC